MKRHKEYVSIDDLFNISFLIRQQFSGGALS